MKDWRALIGERFNSPASSWLCSPSHNCALTYVLKNGQTLLGAGWGVLKWRSTHHNLKQGGGKGGGRGVGMVWDYCRFYGTFPIGKGSLIWEVNKFRAFTTNTFADFLLYMNKVPLMPRPSVLWILITVMRIWIRNFKNIGYIRIWFSQMTFLVLFLFSNFYSPN